jgi:hypothetical protein
MNQTLRPQPQLGEVLPGALTFVLFIILAFDRDPDVFNNLINTGPGLLAIIGGAFLLASWIFGTVLDSLRNGIVENIVDWCGKH